MSMKGWFLISWLLVLSMQSPQLVLLGVLYIVAVFLYHYRRGMLPLAALVVFWYWVTASVSSFFWVRFDLWFAGWIYVCVVWFVPLALASLMPFSQPESVSGEPE